MKNISILGSTGSIGRQAIEVAMTNPEEICVKVLAAHSSDQLLEEQIKKVQPDFVVLTDEDAALRLQSRYKGKTHILTGASGLKAAASYEGVDTVLASMVGYAGLEPTLTAINCGKNIALANKETLVAAGSLVMEAAERNNTTITPVDSEHSAIFQALRAGGKNEVKCLIITASGGPFRGLRRSQLEHVSLEQCLSHPNWSMGKKITVDSSTLANKGLEVIEAHWLFNVSYDKISVVVHPQSIIHSLVEFVDGSIVAQLGEPDMRLPIQYALSWPKRFPNAYKALDLVKAGTLTFEEPDVEAFPALSMAVACGKSGGTLPCAFNAANEEAVYAFLAGKIKYLDIAYITAKVVDTHKNRVNPRLEDIVEADQEARRAAGEHIKNLS